MWRESGKALTFFGIDGRVMFLLLLVLYRPRWWTLSLAVFGIVLLILLERNGYTIPNAIRRIRVFFTGPNKLAVIGRRLGRSDR